MKLIVFAALIFSLTACSGGGGGSGSSQDQVYGDWYYLSPNSTENKAYGIQGKIDAGGAIEFSNIYAYGTNDNATMYFRKSVGTFAREGDIFDVKYSHETCSPVGSERLILKVLSNGSLSVKSQDGSVEITFLRGDRVAQVKSVAKIEDKNCDILSKLEGSSKRAVANSAKSFFSRIIK